MFKLLQTSKGFPFLPDCPNGSSMALAKSETAMASARSLKMAAVSAEKGLTGSTVSMFLLGGLQLQQKWEEVKTSNMLKICGFDALCEEKKHVYNIL